MSEPNQTCETCDWWCYGTWPGGTCDKWERTIFEVDVPDEVLGKLMKVPSASDMDKMYDELDRIGRGMNGLEEP